LVRLVSRGRRGVYNSKVSAVGSLADEYWAFFVDTEQLRNIERGDLDHIDRWEDLSGRGVAERIEHRVGFAARASTMPSADEDERATLAVIADDASAGAVELPWIRDRMYVSMPVGIVGYLTNFLARYPLRTSEHGEGYVAKLNGFGSFIDGWIDGLQDGQASGRLAPARGVAASIEAIERHLAAPVGDDAFVAQPPPEDLDELDVAAWRARVVESVERVVRPAWARLATFLRDEVLASGQDDERPGLCHLERGDEEYSSLLRASTSGVGTADDVHQLGHEIIDRLADEYRTLGYHEFGTSDVGEILERVRDATVVAYADPAAVLRHVEAILARARAVVDQWFTRLPRATCRAVGVEEGPIAFYGEPSPDGLRGGTLFFNTADPSAWGVDLEATVFHESIPGHHLQIALAQELGLHPLRAEICSMSYAEGWALYAERLADEMGLYSSPLARLGMLANDSMRACRLVVDTGIHAKGWSRRTAIEFLHDNSAVRRGVCENEIDRYIAWPGQATTYMVGRVEIERLRSESTQALGPNFQLRDFHDVVLSGGALPLDALARRVSAWRARLDAARDAHSPASDS
jgi:uncharacterized protein (DUF885 family)